jgi:Domain of unknown function (DUF4349)/Putative zinc-finger
MTAETHPVTPEELMAYHDGELSPDRAGSVTAHLQSCRQCEEMGGILRGASQVLADWTIAPASCNASFERRLSEMAAKAVSAKRGLFQRCIAAFGIRQRFFHAAAAAAIVVVGFAVVSSSTHRRLLPGEVTVTQPQILPLTLSRDSAPEKFEPKNFEASRETAALDALTAQRDALIGRLQQQQISSSLENSSPNPGPQELPPMIARTVSLSLLVQDFPHSRAAVDTILARHHGYAATLTANTQQNAARSLQASLRIPAGELAASAAELKSLGQVENEAQTGEEVTQQHADLAARLSNSRETEQRLQAILVQRAGKISDVLAVEQEVARVRGEIEQMEAEQKSLEHRVNFATIDLTLLEEYKAQVGSGSSFVSTRFHNALVAGFRSAVESALRVALFIVEDGPVALLWLTALAPLVWFLRRRWIRAASFGR